MSRIEVVAIGPNAPGFDVSPHAIRTGQVACPNTSTQAVQGVVGYFECLTLILEGRQREHRPKDLFLEHAHLVISLQDSGLIIVTTFEFTAEVVAFTADQQFSTFIETNFDIVLDLLNLSARHLCTDLCGGIERAT